MGFGMRRFRIGNGGVGFRGSQTYVSQSYCSSSIENCSKLLQNDYYSPVGEVGTGARVGTFVVRGLTR